MICLRSSDLNEPRLVVTAQNTWGIEKMMYLCRSKLVGMNRAIHLYLLRWDQNGLGGVVQGYWKVHDEFCKVWEGLG